MRTILSLATALFIAPLFAQQWVEMMQDPEVNFYDVQQAFNEHWEGQAYVKGNGYKQFKRWEWFMEPRVFPTGERPRGDETWKAWQEIQKRPRTPQEKSTANWTPVGPSGWTSTSYNPGNGRVNVVAVDPQQSNIMYVGTPSAGIWKSTDAGGTWSYLFDGMPSLGVSGIVIDHTDTDHLYIATGDGDGGDTYSAGVLESNDGGMTWSTTGLSWSGPNSLRTYKLLMHPSDPLTLFCASNSGLWKSMDGGVSWITVLQGRIRDMEFKPNDPTVVYASTDEFFKSMDGGDSFTQILSGLPLGSEVNRMSIAVSENDPTVVYALCGDEVDAKFLGLYRSHDSGTSFLLRSDSPNLFGYSDTGSDNSGQSWYDMALAVEPTNVNVVYVGGINVWKSINGGTTWDIKSHWVWPTNPGTGYTHADIHTLDFFGGSLYCGSDGGIFRSDNGGDQWSDLSSGLNITQFYRMGSSEAVPSIIIAGSQDNGSNLYDGTGWTHVLGADGMEAAIDPNDPMTIYASTQNGGLTRSDDGGGTFNGIGNGITDDGGWVTPYVIDPLNGDRLYAGFQDLWRSDDRGDNWVRISNYSPTENVDVLAVAPSDPDHIYFGNEQWLRYTSNGGNSWLIITNNLSLFPSAITVHPHDPTVVYACMSGYQANEKVFVYNSAAQYWENLSAGLPNVPVNTIVFAEGSPGGLYVGTDIGVFYTDSTLSTWQPYSDGLPQVMVSELEINQTAGKLRAATYGRGVWETDLFTPSTQPPVAGFTHTDPAICAGGTIQFFDASLDAAPAWDWQFPGGTPATSTDASPMVTYPSSGTYAVTLTMHNTNGSDVHSMNIPVVVQPNELELSISFDDFANESSWKIFDMMGNEVKAGGPYTSSESNTTRDLLICLTDGCYTFYFYDSYGDGICCGFGNGSYTLSDPLQGVLATGGQFTFQDSTSFCTFPVSVPAITRSDLQVFPNPTTGLFTVELTNADGDLRVIDNMGRIILDRPVNTTIQHLDLTEQAAGSYLLEWKNEEQRQRVPLLLID